MRYLLVLIGLSAFGQGIPFPGIKPPAAAAACSGTNTYVGNQDTSGTSSANWSGEWTRQDGGEAWSIGGSGTVTICAIQAYAKTSDASTDITARLAVYDASNNLVCQGSAPYSVSPEATFRWEGHSYGVDLSGTCTLDRSQTYRIAFIGGSVKAFLHYVSGASGVSKYGTGSYISGWPSTLSGGSDFTLANTLRVGYQ